MRLAFAVKDWNKFGEGHQKTLKVSVGRGKAIR
jgi:hypothetical protein